MNQVHITWERRPQQPTAESLRRIVRGVLRKLGEQDVDVSILMTGDDRIRSLSRKYMDRDRATDVLSFPDGDEMPNGRRLLGEIVISLDSAGEQAARLGHSIVRELEELTLHGTLHLLGYDHQRDQGEMNRLELHLREELLT